MVTKKKRSTSNTNELSTSSPCPKCVKGKRSTKYCRIQKEHTTPALPRKPRSDIRDNMTSRQREAVNVLREYRTFLRLGCEHDHRATDAESDDNDADFDGDGVRVDVTSIQEWLPDMETLNAGIRNPVLAPLIVTNIEYRRQQHMNSATTTTGVSSSSPIIEYSIDPSSSPTPMTQFPTPLPTPSHTTNYFYNPGDAAKIIHEQYYPLTADTSLCHQDRRNTTAATITANTNQKKKKRITPTLVAS